MNKDYLKNKELIHDALHMCEDPIKSRKMFEEELAKEILHEHTIREQEIINKFFYNQYKPLFHISVLLSIILGIVITQLIYRLVTLL